MRKITRLSAQAFANNGISSIDNTIVNNEGVFLFGNHIAKRVSYGVIAVNFCGYPTRTTCDRLGAIVNLLSIGRLNIGTKKGLIELRHSNGKIELLDPKGWQTINTLITKSDSDKIEEIKDYLYECPEKLPTALAAINLTIQSEEDFTLNLNDYDYREYANDEIENKIVNIPDDIELLYNLFIK